ncbi:MAG: polynucleotide adenylyltransferase PcnB [Legionella sp.]|nr:polynucleotide adenylyltransferase PcnB [Legionella sp.]
MIPIIKLIKKLLRKTRARHQPIEANYIIPRSQHALSKTDLSVNALKVLNRLNSAGFQAYLVGGSVRDLLLGKVPKDFDVATNATPQQIKKLFSNARIIGRRFKLVHVIFYREIIEVATFRADHTKQPQETSVFSSAGMVMRDNQYGTLEEDAWRRDFTINSLYYNIDDASIVDMTQGMRDIHKKTIRMIGDPTTRYQEDPVRMLRAIRFAAKLRFSLEETTATPIAPLSHLLGHVASSRLFDEITKLYHCGEAEVVQQLLLKHQLFKQLFPQTANLLEDEQPLNAFIGLALENTDVRIRQNKPVTPAFLFAIFLWFPLKVKATALQSKEELPALNALEQAMSQVLSEQNKVITIPKRFSQVMREIWLLQFRFSNRAGNRAFNLLQHPRFRAAYDFLALRALCGDESLELAQWWETFQVANETEQAQMIKALSPTLTKRSKRRPKRKKPLSTSNETSQVADHTNGSGETTASGESDSSA